LGTSISAHVVRPSLEIAVDAEAFDDVRVGVIPPRARGVEPVRQSAGRGGHGEHADDGENDPCEYDEAPVAQGEMSDQCHAATVSAVLAAVVGLYDALALHRRGYLSA
jgi:hypothetical protein